MANIALVDDHSMIRQSLSLLILSMGHTVMAQAENGREFIETLNPHALPDILLLDIHMPIMNGYETASFISKHYPFIKIIALSVFENEEAIVRMLRNGARGFLKKSSEPGILKKAIDLLQETDCYYIPELNSRGLNYSSCMRPRFLKASFSDLTKKQIEFLHHASSELTYKEIAVRMGISTRTVDDYRETLFKKLNTRSRIGLVLHAIRSGVIDI
jgi:two-component system, NarL family, invasion response regulator UvrY